MEIPEVDKASLVLQRSVYEGVFHLSTGLSNGFLVGVDENYFDVYGYNVSVGRLFSGRDFDGTRKVAILDSGAQETLFPENRRWAERLSFRENPLS